MASRWSLRPGTDSDSRATCPSCPRANRASHLSGSLLTMRSSHQDMLDHARESLEYFRRQSTNDRYHDPCHFRVSETHQYRRNSDDLASPTDAAICLATGGAEVSVGNESQIRNSSVGAGAHRTHDRLLARFHSGGGDRKELITARLAWPGSLNPGIGR
jgi:hypothetical protein